MSDSIVVALGALFGLIFGSFFNVIIVRLPKMLAAGWQQDSAAYLGLPPPSALRFNLAFPHSHCPACGHALAAWENIPLLSFIFLRGTCHHCSMPIPWRYPLVEFCASLLAAGLLWRFGPTEMAWGGLVLCWSLLILAAIDWETRLLPDCLTLPLVWAGLLFHVWTARLPVADAVLGAVFAYMLFWSVFWGFKWATGKEGMGFGDFKLFAALGAWFGWAALPEILLIAAGGGVLHGLIQKIRMSRTADAQVTFPFGPWLAFAGCVTYFMGYSWLEVWLG